MASNPNRRKLLKTATAGTVAAATASAFPSPSIAKGKREWKMVMTWQTSLPGLGTGAVRLAKRITAMTEGKLTVKPYGGGELVPALGVFDAVSQGTAEMGHSAPYYWLSKNRASSFFCSVPGGLTANEQNGWLYFGGGQKLWNELYAEFGLVGMPAGNTGCQMGGWFNKELETIADLKGLKMRLPGLGGEVFTQLGGSAQVIPPQELFTAMQSGLIDALEWVGPWNDLALGFHRVSQYYYGPAFHEGSATLELMINKKAYDALPKDLQRVVKIAAATENNIMQAEFQANNIASLSVLQNEHKVDIRRYPDAILQRFMEVSRDVVADVANENAIAKKIHDSYMAYKKKAQTLNNYTDLPFMQFRV